MLSPQRRVLLNDGGNSEDPVFKALCKLLFNMKLPQPTWGVEFGLGMGSLIWGGEPPKPAELQALSTEIIQSLSSIGAIVRFRTFVEYVGELSSRLRLKALCSNCSTSFKAPTLLSALMTRSSSQMMPWSARRMLQNNFVKSWVVWRITATRAVKIMRSMLKLSRKASYWTWQRRWINM